MKKNAQPRWLHTVEAKLTGGVVLIIVVIMLCTMVTFHEAILLAKSTTYDKMYSQAEFYQQQLDSEIRLIRQLQQVFFSYRKIPMIVNDDLIIDGYEKRDALLSIEERLYTMT